MEQGSVYEQRRSLLHLPEVKSRLRRRRPNNEVTAIEITVCHISVDFTAEKEP